MKRKVLKLSGAAVLIAVGVWIGIVVAKPLEANSNAIAPGSIEDPVVSKSYVDEQITKLLGNVGGTGGGNTGGSAGGNNGNNGSGGDTAANAVLEVVEVPVGKVLMAAAGSEVVIRVGKAVAYSSDTNGISDLTGGVDIKSGKPVPTNHLIWFPREGRGIQAAPEETLPLTVLVKGNYTLK